MVEIWSRWQHLPDAQHPERLQAPSGPGLYEVRDFETGDVIAFNYTPDVASTLSNIDLRDSTSLWRRLMYPKRISHNHRDMEYRTRAAATTFEAKTIASSLSSRRHMVMCRRVGLRDIGR